MTKGRILDSQLNNPKTQQEKDDLYGCASDSDVEMKDRKDENDNTDDLTETEEEDETCKVNEPKSSLKRRNAIIYNGTGPNPFFTENKQNTTERYQL